MDEASPDVACTWCFRTADEAVRLNVHGLCADCQLEFADMLGDPPPASPQSPLSLVRAFDVFHQLTPTRLVEALRLAVAYHHRAGFGDEADAVWEACVAGYRAAGRPFGNSDAGFGRWLLHRETGTFAAAGAARLIIRYFARDA